MPVSAWDVLEGLEEEEVFPGLSPSVPWPQSDLTWPSLSLLGWQLQPSGHSLGGGNTQLVVLLYPHLEQRCELLSVYFMMDPFSRFTATFERIQRDSRCSREPPPAPQHKLLWWEIPVRHPPPTLWRRGSQDCSELLKTCGKVTRNSLCYKLSEISREVVTDLQDL